MDLNDVKKQIMVVNEQTRVWLDVEKIGRENKWRNTVNSSL